MIPDGIGIFDIVFLSGECKSVQSVAVSTLAFCLFTSARVRIEHNYSPRVVFPLTSSTAPDYNTVFSDLSVLERTLNERVWETKRGILGILEEGC